MRCILKKCHSMSHERFTQCEIFRVQKKYVVLNHFWKSAIILRSLFRELVISFGTALTSKNFLATNFSRYEGLIKYGCFPFLNSTITFQLSSFSAILPDRALSSSVVVLSYFISDSHFVCCYSLRFSDIFYDYDQRSIFNDRVVSFGDDAPCTSYIM